MSLTLYELKPRVTGRPSPLVFGHSFVYCLANHGGRLRLFVATSVARETLKKYFDVSGARVDTMLGPLAKGKIFYAVARLKNPSSFYVENLELADLPGAVSKNRDAVVCVSAERSEDIAMMIRRRGQKILLKTRDPGMRQIAKSIVSSSSERYVLKIVILADKGALKRAVDSITSISNLALTWETGAVRNRAKIKEIIAPYRPSLFEKILGRPKPFPTAERGIVAKTLEIPDPSRYSIAFVRGSPLPTIVPERPGQKFRIGAAEDGTPVHLSVEDLKRHMYIVGATGTGKTSFIKLLVHRLYELKAGSIIVIDPHGDMAEELAKEIPEALYLHPIRSPFGVNPLDLPKHDDRELAISIAIDAVLETFTEILKLRESAVNTRYLLQVLLRFLYQKTDSPTFAQVYNAILALRAGQLDLDVNDPKWNLQLDALRSLQAQTFTAALSRLEMYAMDATLRRITSRTTIDMDEILSPGSITIFSIAKSDLGENLSRLIAGTIVLKVWYEVYARARLKQKRSPVFLIIDEFQFIEDMPALETILSEARKFGLHLIMAHQHTAQISKELLEGILGNAGVIAVFRVGGPDIKRLALIDKTFADQVAKSLSALTVGRALVKFTALAGEEQPPPVVVRLDYVEHRPRRREIYTEAYAPPQSSGEDVASLLNPFLKYPDLPRFSEWAVAFALLKGIVDAGGLEKPVRFKDVITRLGMERDLAEDALAVLVREGVVEQGREGGAIVVRALKQWKDLFDFSKAAPSEEGRRLAEEVFDEYLKNHAMPVVARQDLDCRPDLVVFPYDWNTFRPLYSEAIAVEIETSNEIERHPEKVVDNWKKPCAWEFKEIHVYVPAKYQGRVMKLLPPEPRLMGRIMITGIPVDEAPKGGGEVKVEQAGPQKKEIGEPGVGEEREEPGAEEKDDRSKEGEARAQIPVEAQAGGEGERETPKKIKKLGGVVFELVGRELYVVINGKRYRVVAARAGSRVMTSGEDIFRHLDLGSMYTGFMAGQPNVSVRGSEVVVHYGGKEVSLEIDLSASS